MGNKMPTPFQNFSVCLGKVSAKKKKEKKAGKDSAQTFVYYVGTGFGIPRHSAEDYDLFF